MKKTFLLGFLMILSSLVFSSSAFAQKFEIASFNIWSIGPSNKEGLSENRLESIRKLVLNENLDFIGLQEVDSNTTRNRNKDLLYDVSKGILPYQIYGQTSEGFGGVYGNAMLTKLNVKGELVNLLPHEEGVRERRAYQRVVLEKNGYFVAVYNTHLTYDGESKTLRKRQLATLLSVLENDPIPNKILMGDFNLASTEELKVFENKGYKTVKGANGEYLQTYPTNKRSKTVKDVILVSSNINIISGSIKGTNVHSDHHMVRATIDVSEKGDNNLRFENNIMFTIGKDGFLQRAEEYVNNKRNYVREYYPNAVYGKHGNQIRYRFTIGRFGNVESAFRKKQGTFTIDQKYSYYPNAKYGIHGSKIKSRW